MVLTYYNRVMDNWRTTNGYSGTTLEADDTYYYYKMKEILEAFPNKGPPYAPSRISHHIYMGSLRNAEDIPLLKRLGITHVLNVTGTRRFDLTRSPYSKDSGVKEFLMMPAEDHDHYDMSQHFHDAFAFLDDCKHHNGKALIHCNLGVNRSGAIVAAYMMVDTGMRLLDVCSLLKMKRAIVLCNKSFRRQLITFARSRNFLDRVTMQDIEALAIKKKKLMKEEFHPMEIYEYVVEPRNKRYTKEEAPRGIPPNNVSMNTFAFRRPRNERKVTSYIDTPSESMARPLRINNYTSRSLDSASTAEEDSETPSDQHQTIAVHVPSSTGYSSLPRHMRSNNSDDVRTARPHSMYSSMKYLDPNDKTYHTLPRALSSGYAKPRKTQPSRSAMSYTSPRSPFMASSPRSSSYSSPRSPSYSAPRSPSYSSPRSPSYSAPRSPSYSAPRSPSYSSPISPSYSSLRSPSSSSVIPPSSPLSPSANYALREASFRTTSADRKKDWRLSAKF